MAKRAITLSFVVDMGPDEKPDMAMLIHRGVDGAFGVGVKKAEEACLAVEAENNCPVRKAVYKAMGVGQSKLRPRT